MSDEESSAGVESRIPAPDLSCPKCNNLLPNGLGIITCLMCKTKVNVEHEGTRKKWREEKISCPSCSKVLVCGVDKRPANLQCASCSCQFTVKPNVPRIEIQCPSCERRLRMKKRPGERVIDCPACETTFKVKF